MQQILFKPEPAAAYLGIGLSTFYRLVRAELIRPTLLPPKKEGGKPLVMYHVKDLDAFAEGCRQINQELNKLELVKA